MMARSLFRKATYINVGRACQEVLSTYPSNAMIAVQALEQRTAESRQKDARIAVLESQVEALKAKQTSVETLAVRLERLNRATGDSYTHAAILACCSAAMGSTAAVTSGVS